MVGCAAITACPGRLAREFRLQARIPLLVRELRLRGGMGGGDSAGTSPAACHGGVFHYFELV